MLQSWEWGEFRRHHGWRPLRLLSDDGKAAAQTLLRRVPVLGSLAYIPHGPICAEEEDPGKTAAAIAEMVRAEGAYTLKVEPRIREPAGFSAPGFTKSASSIQPRCTLIARILEDPEEQLKALPKDTRYGIRKAGREEIEAGPSESSEDIEQFLNLLEHIASRQHFALRPRDYYRRFMAELPAHLIVARQEGRVLAGAMILVFGEEAYYLYGASAREGDNLYASYLVQFEAFNTIRRAGARRYDMWGIPCDPRQDHPLWGVYQFKKKFAGEEERYTGTYEKNLSPIRASLARTGIQGYYSLQRLRGKSSGPIND